MKGEKRFKEALECYETSNAKSISRYGAEDPVTYNNRGNAHAGLGEWDKAVEVMLKPAHSPGYNGILSPSLQLLNLLVLPQSSRDEQELCLREGKRSPSALPVGKL